MIKMFSLSTTSDPEAVGTGNNIITGFFALLTLTGVITGIYGFFIHHEFYNITREVPWGILISAYAFFAITSTGLGLLAAISHLFGGNRMAPLANRMVWMSMITIISGFLIIGMEIVIPWRMLIWNLLSPNPTSNIWWMGTLYGLAVGFVAVELWLIFTRRFTIAIWLGVIAAITKVAANSCLGGVFSTLASHPLWFGSQLPIFFIACAFTSGAAAAIVFTYFASVIRGKKMTETVFLGVQAAGKVLILMLILIGIATFWKMMSFYVGGVEEARMAADTLVSGPLAMNFWIFEITVGIILPLLLLVVTRLKNATVMAVAGLLTLVGMFVARLNMVVAGQLVPHYHGFEDYPELFVYTPSGAEWIVAFAGIGLTGLAFMLGERFFGKAFDEHHEAH